MKKWQQTAIAIGTLSLGLLVYGAIQAASKDVIAKDSSLAQDLLVSTVTLQAEDYQLLLPIWAEVQPQEQTQLTPEVSGRVIAMHPEFIEGGLIRKGDVMVTLDDADYQAQLLAAEAAVANATAILEQELALAQVAKAENRSVAPERLTALALRKPQLHSAEASLKSAQSALKKAQRDLQRTRIVAPYDALITNRTIGMGQVVHGSTVLATLMNIEFAELRLPIANFDWPLLASPVQGSAATIAFQGQQRTGTVVRDLGRVQTETRMQHLVVQVQDPYGLRQPLARLPFGSFVEVTLTGRLLQQIFILPQESVQNNQVWLVDADSRLQPREVTILRQQGKQVLVSEGLRTGEQLVLTPPSFPQPGSLVRTAPMAAATRSQ